MKEAWKPAKLGDIADVQSGGTPSISNQTFWGGDIPWYSSGELNAAITSAPQRTISAAGIAGSNAKLFPAGSLLIGMYDTAALKMSILDRDAAFNQAIAGVKPNGMMNMRFVFYALNAVKDELLGQRRGVRQKNLSLGKVRDFPIPLPPLREQSRIVAVLDEAFESITTARANAEKNLQNARELIGTGYRSIVESFDQSQWGKAPVADLAAASNGSMRTGPFGSQLLHSEFVDDGIAVLGIDNAVANEFRWDKRRYITEAKFRSLARYRVHPGDVLITIMGTCGRCAVVPDDIPLAINTKHLCCITLDRKKCLPDYLHLYFLHDPLARAYLAAQAKGSIMAGLNMGIISALPVQLPPIDQQANIVERFNSLQAECDRLADVQTRKLAALDELKHTLLHQAFTGGLSPSNDRQPHWRGLQMCTP
jgi:type I restriction enzyme S subunit